MSHSHSSAERDRSSIKVSVSELDVDALIASLDSDSEPGLRDSLQNASVLIIPTDLQPEYDGPAFPETTLWVLDYLRERLGDTATVDAIAKDEDYAEFAYRSEDIFLPHVFVASEVLVPLVVSLLGSFLYDLVNRRRDQRTQSHVNSEIYYKDGSGKILSIKYDGPADTYERTISQALPDPSSLLEDEESDNH